MNLYEIATMQAAWVQVPRGVLRVEGREAAKWLRKIITANVEELKTGRGAHSALLDAKGHFVADFVLLRDGDAFGMLSEPAARDALYNTLKRYILREKVELADVSARWKCFTLVGEQAVNLVAQVAQARAPVNLHDWEWGHIGESAARVVRVARARVPAYDIMVPISAAPELRAALHNVPELSDEILDILRIEAGLPRWGVDFDETTLALEIPDVMQIRVDQGCYVGQEVVARLVHRGHVNRHLRGLMVEGMQLPARGQAIRFEGADVGNVTSAAHSPKLGAIALGYVRRHVEPGALVKMNDCSARVAELPFLLNTTP